ncbi:MAG: recombinase family protein, partial [Candidatus Methanomethylicia archaeon]
MENKPKIRAVIYARVSTKEQAEGKFSIPEERRVLQNLLYDARQHLFDLVVVKDFDRFARNRAAATIVREELKKLFIQTYALNTPVEPKDPKSYDPTDDDLGIMVEGYSDTISEIERNKIRRRMMMGKMNLAKQGKIPVNVPYGYEIKRTIDEHGKI